MTTTEVISNTSIMTGKQNSNAGHLLSTNEAQIGEMIHIVFGGVIIVVGTVGNLTSFIVLRKGDLKKLSTCFYMSMLAVVDLGRFIF